MKLSHCLPIALSLLVFAFGQTAHAQSILASPKKIDYQGKVLDSAGNPLAASSPTNYQMIFRIYSAQSGGALIWSEQQTVTVSNGLFSVQLGNGLPYLTEPNLSGDVSQAFTSTTFNGVTLNDSARYIGVTVVIPPATAGNAGEITPRLAFLSSPFAYAANHAVTADAVNGVVNASVGSTFSGTITGAVNGSTITGTAATPTILTGPITATGATESGGTYTGGTFSGAGSGLTGLNATAIASGTLADSRLSGNVALLNGNNVYTGSATFNTLPFTINTGVGILNVVSDGATELFASGGAFPGILRMRYSLELHPSNGITGGSGRGGHITMYDTSDSADISMDGGASGAANLTLGGGANVVYIQAGSPYPRIGIGTNAPGEALDIEGAGVANSYGGNYGYLNNINPTGLNSNLRAQVSIYCSQRVVASEFDAVSDARIKNVGDRSKGDEDLATLSRIAITNYTYKDTLEKDARLHKKVIAQQVEQVLPEAVSRKTGVVPDIFQKAAIKEGWVLLASDLKKGERVRLIGERTRGEFEVLEVQPGKFRTDFRSESGEVFVYGREVNDFRSVDYEAIAMLNVSATQEIARQKDAEVKSLRAENEALQIRLAALEKHLTAVEARSEEREARVAKLEQTLSTAPAVKPAIVPAALSAAR